MLFAIVPVGGSANQLGSTYAGWNVPENSPLNVGMAPASWRNSYYAGDASTPWTMQFYDYEGSLNVPDVSPYDSTLNEYVVRTTVRPQACA
jgi:hypothetical protein